MTSLPDPAALLELARQDLATDQLAAAQAKCLQVLGTHHHHPGALELLGTALHRQGQPERAVRVFNALTLLQPTVAAHWQNLGAAWRAAGRREQALAAFEQALRLGAPSAGLLYNLGALQMDLCDYQAAYVALRDASALAPTDGLIRWAFAQCCYDSARREEARAALASWQELEGLTEDVTARIVLLLVVMGATAEAEPALSRLLAHPPQQPRPALAVIAILERLHRLDAACALMERLVRDSRALESDPDRLLMSAVLAERAGRMEEAHRALTVALEHHREFLHRYQLLFPLARVCDALGRHAEAYAAAEEAHRSQLAFLAAATGKRSVQDSQLFALTARGCDPHDVAAWAGAAASSAENPIFIVGFPRSGTTLLEQVLDAHPLLQSMDEQPFLLKALAELSAHGVRYPDELGQLTPQGADEIRARYWQRARSAAGLAPDQRLVDKNPLNLILLPLIVRLFPAARIVVAIRHPCDTLLSCFLQNFRTPDLALLSRDLMTLATAYSRVFEFWYAQSAVLHPTAHELRYELLTSEFRSEVERIASFLELPWDDAMLSPGEHARRRGIISTPSYAQVLEPVSGRSVGRFRPYAQHFTQALPVLVPWAERWGYSLE